MNLKKTNHVFTEKGSALIITIVVLAALSLIGIAATNTSLFDFQIADSDRLQKEAFYFADAGTEMASELLEQNIQTTSSFEITDTEAGTAVFETVEVETLNFWLNTQAGIPSDAYRDFFMPEDYSGNEPHTNFKVGGATVLSIGSAIQMASGYAGKGKSIASGGSSLVYDIYAQRIGRRNSQAVIMIQWRHVIGM